MWSDGVVPLWQRHMRCNVDLVEVVLGDLLAGVVAFAVERGVHGQAGFGADGSDVVEHELKGCQWYTGPVETDLAKEAVVDGVHLEAPEG